MQNDVYITDFMALNYFKLEWDTRFLFIDLSSIYIRR